MIDCKQNLMENKLWDAPLMWRRAVTLFNVKGRGGNFYPFVAMETHMCHVCFSGKGEQGKPYPLAEDECDDSVYKENGFNIYVSNNIALDRSLPDIRHPK